MNDFLIHSWTKFVCFNFIEMPSQPYNLVEWSVWCFVIQMCRSQCVALDLNKLSSTLDFL